MNSSTSPTCQHFPTSSTTTTTTATKRHRTTRHRSSTIRSESDYTSSSSNSHDYSHYYYYSAQEHIAANCLILLSRSASTNTSTVNNPTNSVRNPTNAVRNPTNSVSNPTNSVRNPTNGVRNPTNGAVFECKTCNRIFHSFQALGGHRASHKKPINNKKIKTDSILAVRSPPPPSSPSDHDDDETDGQDESMKKVNSKLLLVRMHGCSICGTEFSSGQALGGHMRRHRPPSILHRPIEIESSSSRNFQPLDLNLPAPIDDYDYDDEISLFCDRVLAFTPALVDCHY